MAEWTYDSAAHKYRSGERTLTQPELLALRNAVADGMGEESAGLATRLVAGSITLLDWAASFARLIADGLTAAFLLGRGGTAAMDATANTTLSGLIAAQHEYAKSFVSDVTAAINDGSVTEAGVAERSALYSGGAVHAFETGQAASWELVAPAYPTEDSPCGGNCRCWLTFDETDTDYLIYWNTVDDSHTCDVCAQRGEDYNPYTVPKSDEELAA
jgi:hypothetical protein